MKNNRSSTNWLIDAALFTSFIALFFLELTGVVLHQWLGVAAGALALYHLITHWEWVKAVSQRLFGRTTWQARMYFLVDAPLLLGFGAILVSGLLISTWFNVPLGSAASAWADFHVMASQATLLLVVFKIAIHWRWIVKTARRVISLPTAPAMGKPVTAPSGIARRDFIKLMGVVGAAAALALFQTTSTAVAANAETDSAQGAFTTEAVSSAAPCTRRCPKGRSCAYPGSCRQYVDSNRNGRCDLGECL